ncbi:hypothetical protein HF086_016253 [Spodoptera exigua]|uniref:PiggyBac transposable element-derived protein domain-containing protein n=1 Tax=Spodoptera exigua TaxID=7107 RepID=A0A922M457_SPOEX|nr:hypothetical protein HF086_016253 [Spodoptera exigua]
MYAYTDYWSKILRYNKIADIMTLKKFQLLRRYLHFNDNLKDDGDTDTTKSIELLQYLRDEYGVFALGTIRANRLREAEKKLPTDKNFH